MQKLYFALPEELAKLESLDGVPLPLPKDHQAYLAQEYVKLNAEDGASNQKKTWLQNQGDFFFSFSDSILMMF